MNFFVKSGKYVPSVHKKDTFLWRFVLLSWLFLGLVVQVHAQADERSLKAPTGELPLSDSLRQETDSVGFEAEAPQTIQPSVPRYAERGDIDTTIFYNSRDSIHFSLKKNTMVLYGDAKITYGDTELEADRITIDNNTSTIFASGLVDSLGRRVGFPLFKEGKEVYETRDILYNFKLRQAKISEVVTKQGDGFLHGDQVFKSENNELYTLGNSYTTCNLAKSHFRIVSKKAKMIPNDKIVTGPFYMEINDVPTPLGFAFGAFPLNQSNTSGVIFPRYGEEGRRGFFLTGLGYYFDISEYIKLKVTSDIYTKGAFAARVNTVYRKRYAFSGSLNFTYTNNSLTYDVENDQRQADYNLQWTHSSNTTNSSRFSASVNIASSKYTSNNLLQFSDNVSSSQINNTSRKLSSNISYSKTFRGTPFSLGVNLRHNQDLVTKQVDLTLPSITFNVKNLYPFRKVSDNEFLETLSLRYTMAANQQITNKIGRVNVNGIYRDSIAPFDVRNLSFFFEQAKRSVRHNIPVSGSIKLFKYFVINPSFNYAEDWYFERWNWGLDTTGTRAVVVDTLRKFGRVYRYSASVGLTTRLYGMYVFKNSRLKAIRHIINPSISYSYSPDFSDPSFGFFQEFKTTDNRELKQFIYNGGSPSRQESSSLNFSIGNSFEMKVQSAKDTVPRKISLLNSLNISSSYNFAADSFQLAPFSFSANTNVLKGKLSLNASATLDPYKYVSVENVENPSNPPVERRINRFVWQDVFSLGRITSARLALSTNLSPKGRQRDNKRGDGISQSTMSVREKNFLMDNPELYVDFDIPWNLRLNYTLSYSHVLNQKSKIVQSIRFSGDFSLTKKWKISFNSGYDLENKKITQTNISISRDLHCWVMSFSWVPFGRFQSYSFTIGVRSGILRDLKLDRKRSFFDSN